MWRFAFLPRITHATRTSQQVQQVRSIRTHVVKTTVQHNQHNHASKAGAGEVIILSGVCLAVWELFFGPRHSHPSIDRPTQTLDYPTFTDRYLRHGQVERILLLPHKAIASLTPEQGEDGTLRGGGGVLVRHSMSMHEFSEVVGREQEGRGLRQPEIAPLCCVHTFSDQWSQYRLAAWLIGGGVAYMVVKWTILKCLPDPSDAPPYVHPTTFVEAPLFVERPCCSVTPSYSIAIGTVHTF